MRAQTCYRCNLYRHTLIRWQAVAVRWYVQAPCDFRKTGRKAKYRAIVRGLENIGFTPVTEVNSATP